MTFVLDLLPVIETFAVSGPVYPLAIGRPGATVFPFVFGSLVDVSDGFLLSAIIQRIRAPDVAVVAGGTVGRIVPIETIYLVEVPSSSAEPGTSS